MQLKDTLQLDGRDDSFVAVCCSRIRLRSASEYCNYGVDLGGIAATAAVACCNDSSAGLTIWPTCSLTSSGWAIRVGPSTAILGSGPRTIATSSQAYSRGQAWQSL